MYSLAASKITTLGYAPTTFPRDPVLFNQYAEHMLIGQILTPLVETDQSGNLVAGVANKWTIENSGKKILFTLDSKKFANGNLIMPIDVKYTIERHITSNSQSSEYLKNIDQIIIGQNTVEIILKKSDPTILKALSRDQLGIVPKGWVFDSTSSTPFISSGEYSLVKENEKWLLKKNKNTEKGLNTVELLFYKNDKYEIPDQIPDIVPFTNKETTEKLKTQDKKNVLQIKEAPSFVQNIFWIGHNSILYKNINLRNEFAYLLNKSLELYFKEYNSIPATGIVPSGISGSLPTRVENKKPVFVASTKHKIKFYFIEGSHNRFINFNELSNIFKNSNFDLNFIPYSISNDSAKKLSDADIIATCFAGGFNDPMGFLGILNKIFDVPFDSYLPENIRTYFQDAKDEFNWSKRSKIFEIVNQKTMESNLAIAGWKSPMFSVTINSYEESDTVYRYTPRISKYKFR